PAGLGLRYRRVRVLLLTVSDGGGENVSAGRHDRRVADHAWRATEPRREAPGRGRLHEQRQPENGRPTAAGGPPSSPSPGPRPAQAAMLAGKARAIIQMIGG